MTAAVREERSINVGGIPISVCTGSPRFAAMLEERYGSFLGPAEKDGAFELDVELTQPAGIDPDADASVRFESGIWTLERGDFRAEWSPETRRGWVRQTANPYAIDSVLRILHSLILAQQGGFLMHAASAVCKQQAYLFAGVSGAGKTTLSQLAPPTAVVLTDEVSYVRPNDAGYNAFGTPFAGELARAGENVNAPLAALYLLAKGPENRIESVSETEALRAVMKNILFFAQNPELVQMVFESAVRFVQRVPVKRFVFVPDATAWELIG